MLHSAKNTQQQKAH